VEEVVVSGMGAAGMAVVATGMVEAGMAGAGAASGMVVVVAGMVAAAAARTVVASPESRQRAFVWIFPLEISFTRMLSLLAIPVLSPHSLPGYSYTPASYIASISFPSPCCAPPWYDTGIRNSRFAIFLVGLQSMTENQINLTSID